MMSICWKYNSNKRGNVLWIALFFHIHTHFISTLKNDDYFRFNGYGNVESIPYLDDYLKDMIDEESFYDWCVEQGYFESDEDDE